ncbi:MAG: RHS repeat-associated core domain-containing protein, partial [bacterium]|nr:RHS repeat-associated core domain-containing protein [bacterium]
AAGNRARVDEHDGTSRHYLYDDLYQLTQDRVTDASSVLVYQRDFVYDAVGNRTEQKIDEGSGPTAVGSTYDDRDRLLTAATASYGWDTNGNLTAQDETSYGWDFENRLTSAILADGTVVETRYDADGNRVRTAVTPPGGPTTALDYLVDTTGFLSHVVAEVVGGSVQTLYTRADDQLIGSYQPVSGASSYFHADGLGSVRGLSDELGGITDRYSYTAFGELLEHTGSSFNPYQFAAEPFDPNVGFSYNRARWMDVASGRSLSIDPLAGVGHDPATLHRYSYSLNDPVNRLDPSGEASLLNISIAAAIVNGLAAAALTAYRGGNAGEIVLNGIGVAAATFLLLYYGIPAIEALLVRFWPAIFASSVATGMVVGSTGQLPRSALVQAARSSGRTVEFYSRLTQAPEVGRTLYTATGPAARELASAARPDGVLYLARIPY